MLFTPGFLGQLHLSNRLIRSATAERMADSDGFPCPELEALYRDLAQGGVGLIITGHMYIAEEGKCHPEMTGIDKDDLIPALEKLVNSVHRQGGKVAAQINHGGGNCSHQSVSQTIAPSRGSDHLYKQPARQITANQIQTTITAFQDAAIRAQKAGFDAVQIHSAHGYLISQFLSPLTNHREDQWGGSLENRTRFLKEICIAVRNQVGPEFPLLIKFGIADGIKGGFILSEGLQVIKKLPRWGIDGAEISVGFSGDEFRSIQRGIQSENQEAYLLPFVQQAKRISEMPLIAVGGFRSRKIMERTLLSGAADFISLSRPFIREPDLPRLLKTGKTNQSSCISENQCWPESTNEGISCKCPSLKNTSIS